MDSLCRIAVRRKVSRRRRTERGRRAAWARFARTDRDWDWTYLLGVIDFKLGRMQNEIADGWGADRRLRVAEIRAVRRLIKRVVNNRYLESVTAPHRKRWGRLNWKEGQQHERSVEMVLYFPKAKGPRDQAVAHTTFNALSRRAERQRQADLDELFRLMATHIQRWWD